MPTPIEFSDRLKELPPYLFVEIDKAKRKAIAEGKDIIDLGIGDPDSPTPPPIVQALQEASRDGSNHHYALDAGLPDLRQAIAVWCQRRFAFTLNSDTEIYPCIGSKEGLAHLLLGLVNPKDKVIIPEPCYPGYRAFAILAGGRPVYIPLKAKNDFLPDLSRIEKVHGARLMFVNYPNNPTAAVASREFYTQLVRLAQEKGIILVSDLAYSEIYYEGQKPLSLLEIEGAKDLTIEFHSFSKTFNMTGWRLGWACGNEKLISTLAKVKSNVDSGIFQAIQIAGIAALKTPEEELQDLRMLYEERRDYLVNGLRNLGWKITAPQATFYVWAKIPKKFNDSLEVAKLFLDQANIVVTPGIGFGESGEGYIRMTLTVSKEKINEAVERLSGVL